MQAIAGPPPHPTTTTLSVHAHTHRAQIFTAICHREKDSQGANRAPPCSHADLYLLTKKEVYSDLFAYSETKPENQSQLALVEMSNFKKQIVAGQLQCSSLSHLC